MATHDYIISNASGAAVRADLNNALAAIVSNNSSATAPTTTYAYQWWADTGSTPNVMKLRNSANSAWITLFQLDGEYTTIPLENGTAAAPSIYFKDSGTDTGIFSPGTDQVAISTGGIGRMFVDSSGRLGIGTSSPGDKLHISGSNAGGFRLTNAENSDAISVFMRGGNGIANTTDNAVLSLGQRSDVSLITTGRVGIGNQSPSYRLDVSSGDTVANKGYAVRIRANSTAGAGSLQFTNSTATSELSVITGLSSGLNIGSALMVGLNTTTYPTAANYQISSKTDSAVAFSHFVLANGTQGYFYINVADSYSWNGASQVMAIGKIASNNRSINAAGTVNASGADYAEYMTKAGSFDLAKGDICGINSDGELTNVFAEAVSFVVKSTNPSYVGGDTWGTEDIVGVKPDASDAEAFAEWEAKLEQERQKVDRIAFAGQVPVNVTGANPGQYIVPIATEDGGITGIAKNEADLTLAEYMRAAGKVIAIEDDGRARIIVKVA